MTINLDILIVFCFLIITLVIGVITGRGIKDISEYAVGNRDFTTFTISATIIATWISGGIFSMAVAETYTNGLYFMIPLLGDGLVFLIIGFLLAPRMGNFLGKLSVAETMGDLYGTNAKLITAIVGIFGCAGEIAIQFKVSSVLLQMLFGFSNVYAIGISAFIVIFYSAFGGIRSVTFTDLIQFFTFGTIVPVVTLIIWGTFDNPSTIFQTLSNNPIFDYYEVFNYKNPKFFGTITLMLFFALPHMYPVLFQRISMAKDTDQVSKSFIIAAAICVMVELVICIVGILLYSKDPNLDSNTLFAYILDNYSYVGFKGMVVAGIMAMVMSTTDSYINSAAVMFSHDLCTPLRILKTANSELLVSRIFSIVIGIIAFTLALKSSTILELGMMVWSFYIPIVTVPLVAAIFGFRSTFFSFIISAIAGLLTVIVWRTNFMDTGVDSVIPGMFANILMFFGSHYLFKQEGGWQKNTNKNTKPKQHVLQIRKISYANFKNYLLRSAPKNESVYSLFGFFAIVAVYSTMFTIDSAVRMQYSYIIEFIYHSVLTLSSVFLTYPIWPHTFKNKLFISILWIIGLFYILIFVCGIQVIISSFGQFQLMILLLSMVVLSILVRWQLALFIIITGIISSIYCFKYSYGFNGLTHEFGTIQFKVIYLLLLVSSILVAFFKPKQEYLEATEAQVDILNTEVTNLDHEIIGLTDKITYYNECIADQQAEIARLESTSQKILNNINHELRLPVGNVVNFSDMLNNILSKSNDTHLKDLSDEVLKNSTRLSSMILNMLDLTMLDANKLTLHKKIINFSEIVEDRVKNCRNIYLQDKPINFKLVIEPAILIAVDPNYIRQVIDNLVINAIKFSNQGLITVNVKKRNKYVILTIADQGIGVPPNELFDIFVPFKMGSNAETQSEGRGIGLALCKAAVEAHEGIIHADSDGKNGVTFTVTLPIL